MALANADDAWSGRPDQKHGDSGMEDTVEAMVVVSAANQIETRPFFSLGPTRDACRPRAERSRSPPIGPGRVDFGNRISLNGYLVR